MCQFHSLSRCLSPTDVRTTLSSLPRTLDETYERILVNIPIDYQSKALTALQWIIYSVKELRLDQVSDAIIINPKADPPFSLANRPPEPRWILETLPGLVTIGGSAQKLEIAHFSVVEYLESLRIMDTPVNMFHLDPSKANTTILKDCIDVLKSHSHPINQTFLKYNNRESGGFALSPLYHYACEHWYDHVELLKPPIEEETKSLILDFAVNIESILQGCPSGPSGPPKTIWTGPCWPGVYYPSEPLHKRPLEPLEKLPSEPLERVLHIASRNGLTNIVTTVLDAGADINLTKKDGPTALQRAIGGNWPETVRALVNAGADINFEGACNGLVLTPLNLAVHLREKSTIKILLDAGASVDLKPGLWGCSELQEASETGEADMVELLLKAGADVNFKGGPRGSALCIASQRGDTDTVKLLLDAGADVNQGGGEYGVALQAASWSGDADTVKLLLNAGADVNQKGGWYGSALHAASWNGDIDTVNLLLERGADPNLNHGEFATALHAATWRGQADTVKLLVNRGADLNQKGGEYGSALRGARALRHDDIVNLLLSAGAVDDGDRSAE